ncbi:MAG: hypothetical protein ACUVQK_14305 [Thermogutta sp.]
MLSLLGPIFLARRGVRVLPIGVAALAVVLWAWGLAEGQPPGPPPGLGGPGPGAGAAPPGGVPNIPGLPPIPGTTPEAPEPPPVPPQVPNYLQLSVDASLAAQRQNIQRMLREGNFNAVANGQQVFRDYYVNYFFPSWTQAANRSKLQQLRTQLTNSELANMARGGGPPHDLLVQLALQTLTDYAKNDQLDPAVRVTAMLAIGELNDRERGIGSSAPPAPAAAALPVLIEAITDPQQMDAVKLAALVGLERHSVIGIADANVLNSQVIPLLLNLAQEKNPPAGRDADVHAWFRARAIGILGGMQALGANTQVVQALAGMVGDAAEPVRVRLAAAQALGGLNLASAQGVDFAALVQALGKMVLDLCVADVQASLAGSANTLSSRRIASYVYSAQTGLRAVRGAVGGQPIEQAVGKLSTALDGVTKALNDAANARDPNADLLQRLPQALGKLSTDVQALQPAAPAAPPAGAPATAAAPTG